jgi:hypothetical protein
MKMSQELLNMLRQLPQDKIKEIRDKVISLDTAKTKGGEAQPCGKRKLLIAGHNRMTESQKAEIWNRFIKEGE